MERRSSRAAVRAPFAGALAPSVSGRRGLLLAALLLAACGGSLPDPGVEEVEEEERGPGPATGAGAIAGEISGVAEAAQVAITLRGPVEATTHCDAGGSFSFGALPDGRYSVTPALPGHRFAPPSALVVLGGERRSGLAFAAVPWRGLLSGAVTGACREGVEVWISGALGRAPRRALAGADGAWEVEEVEPGTHAVTPWHPACAFSPPRRAVALTGAGAAGLDFEAVAAAPQVVWGRVTPSAPLRPGAVLRVRLTGDATAAVAAGPGGGYAFAGLGDGTYALWVEGPCGSLAWPAHRAVTLSGEGAGDQDFVLWLPGAAFGGAADGER